MHFNHVAHSTVQHTGSPYAPSGHLDTNWLPRLLRLSLAFAILHFRIEAFDWSTLSVVLDKILRSPSATLEHDICFGGAPHKYFPRRFVIRRVCDPNKLTAQAARAQSSDPTAGCFWKHLSSRTGSRGHSRRPRKVRSHFHEASAVRLSFDAIASLGEGPLLSVLVRLPPFGSAPSGSTKWRPFCAVNHKSPADLATSRAVAVASEHAQPADCLCVKSVRPRHVVSAG